MIGTVKGDIRDIGKNIVAMLIKNAGFNVIDLGVDVPADRFVATLKETGAKALALSWLLNLAITEMKQVVEALDAAGMRSNVKVIIGGSPSMKRFANTSGQTTMALVHRRARASATRFTCSEPRGLPRREQVGGIEHVQQIRGQ